MSFGLHAVWLANAKPRRTPQSLGGFFLLISMIASKCVPLTNSVTRAGCRLVFEIYLNINNKMYDNSSLLLV